GNVLEDFEIEHSALGWKKFREQMRLYGSISLRDRDQPRRGRGATVGSRHAGLSIEPQERSGLPGTQGSQRCQRRRASVHMFSEHTITRCAWAEIYYKAHRAILIKHLY